MLDTLLAALPLLIASITPPLLMLWRTYVAKMVPGYLIPILLPVLGGVIAGVSKAVGYDIGAFNPTTADLSQWETVVAGVLTGLAAVGVHQIGRQAKSRP